MHVHASAPTKEMFRKTTLIGLVPGAQPPRQATFALGLPVGAPGGGHRSARTRGGPCGKRRQRRAGARLVFLFCFVFGFGFGFMSSFFFFWILVMVGCLLFRVRVCFRVRCACVLVWRILVCACAKSVRMRVWSTSSTWHLGYPGAAGNRIVVGGTLIRYCP